MGFIKKVGGAAASLALIILILIGAIAAYSIMFDLFFNNKINDIRSICLDLMFPEPSPYLSSGDSDVKSPE